MKSRLFILSAAFFFTCLLPATSSAQSQEELFIRGDVNQSGSVNITDAVLIFQFLFNGKDSWVAPCNDAVDTNDDGQMDMSDGMNVMISLFLNGAPIPPPNVCGVDPTADELSCEGYPLCDEPSAP